MTDVEKEAMEVASPYARHLGIFNPHDVKASATIVGCGAIGSWVAVGLAKMGLKRLTLYDFDEVEVENVPIQCFGKEAIGLNKAVATKSFASSMCPEETDIETFGKWEKQKIATPIVVSAPDSLEVRKAIFESVRLDPKIKILVDARIGGQYVKIYAIDPSEMDDLDEYEKSFKSMEGSELPCTERGVIDVSLFASALLIRVIRKWLVTNKKERYRAFNLGGDLPSLL